MKKALSVFLAVLMLFASLSVGSFAADEVIDPTPGESTRFETQWHKAGVAAPNQTIFAFNPNGGSIKGNVYTYDLKTNTWELNEAGTLTSTYYMVPMNNQMQIEGRYITLPAVNAPAGWSFDGWFCYDDTSLYGANGRYNIPLGSGGTLITFDAQYSPLPVEGNDNNKAVDILTKVLGTILGLLFYEGDVTKGIAFIKNMIEGILG